MPIGSESGGVWHVAKGQYEMLWSILDHLQGLTVGRPDSKAFQFSRYGMTRVLTLSYTAHSDRCGLVFFMLQSINWTVIGMVVEHYLKMAALWLLSLNIWWCCVKLMAWLGVLPLQDWLGHDKPSFCPWCQKQLIWKTECRIVRVEWPVELC